MVFQVDKLKTHKSERNSPDESQDWADSKNACGLFAISDGLGSAMSSEIWARCLVDHFLAEPLQDCDPFEVEYWLHAARSRFKMPSVERPDSLVQAAIRRGSSATFLGTSFDTVSGDQTELVCNSVAIGDSCLLHYREGNLKRSFPLDHEEDFSGITDNFPTVGYSGNWWERVRHREMRVCAGDTLILATDAVAKWLLVNDAKRRDERFELIARQSADKWPEFVRQIRKAGELEDDDSTALFVRVESTNFDNRQLKERTKNNDDKRFRDLDGAYKGKEPDWEAIARIAGNSKRLLSAKIQEQDKLQTLEAMPQFQQERRKTEALRNISAVLECDPPDLQVLAKLWKTHRDSLSDKRGLTDYVQQLLQKSTSSQTTQASSPHAKPTTSESPPPLSPPPFLVPPSDNQSSILRQAETDSIAGLSCPKVIQWFSWIAIAWGMILVALLLALLLLIAENYFFGANLDKAPGHRGAPTATEISLVVLCALFGPAYLVGGWCVKHQRRCGTWIVGLFLILGLALFIIPIPLAILGFIFWLKPACRHWFCEKEAQSP